MNELLDDEFYGAMLDEAARTGEPQKISILVEDEEWVGEVRVTRNGLGEYSLTVLKSFTVKLDG